MEAATIEKPETEVPADAPEAQEPQQINRYSTWVHVGPGAEDCEAVNEGEGKNDCQNGLHFHAWCRLPNQFQHRQIRERALAAKARKQRQLRDPETDANAILEEDLADVRRADNRAVLIEELLSIGWWKDYFDAVEDVKEREDEDDSKPFASIEDDQRRYDELEAMPEDERPADEHGELGRHLVAYHEAVRLRQEEIIKPKRAELEALDTDQLIERVRGQRIDTAGNDEFMYVYAYESWFVGTLKVPKGDGPVMPPRVFADRDALQAAPPEVIDALKITFEDLERTLNRGASGNS
jgi:hypothetical protein